MAKASKTKVDKIISGIADAAARQNQREKNIARVSIEAEFEIDSNSLADIMMNIQNAIEELTSYGYVTKATLSVPATEMDLV